MTEYLLDTNHLSYLQQEHPDLLRRLAELGDEDWIITSVVNIAELLRGVYLLPHGRRRRALMESCRQLIDRTREIVPITLAVGEQYAETDAALRRKGRPIPVNDVWIAAVALVRGAVLVTNDEHFSHVDGLVTENWVEA